MCTYAKNKSNAMYETPNITRTKKYTHHKKNRSIENMSKKNQSYVANWWC